MRGFIILATTALFLLPAGCSKATGTLEVGACFDSDISGNFANNFNVVDCNTPHQAEVVAAFEATGGPYPGSEVLIREAEDHCTSAFETYVGVKPKASVLELYPLLPTKAAWEEDEDYVVVCVVENSGSSPLMTSVRGYEK